ncbi:Uncharacterized protein FWK35_00025161 [Aphis craccivora]|uniref:Uncharacterized protein n=1 Tax=Aphis craccivora TaxID=307492 RepID=A0A6G0YZM4_APHCR|nr:Uncharacterized protein FWK35_00025161 [Aphis craccivora]
MMCFDEFSFGLRYIILYIIGSAIECIYLQLLLLSAPYYVGEEDKGNKIQKPFEVPHPKIIPKNYCCTTDNCPKMTNPWHVKKYLKTHEKLKYSIILPKFNYFFMVEISNVLQYGFRDKMYTLSWLKRYEKIFITSRNNAPISNYGGGYRCKSEYPWCIIEVKS